MCRTILGGQPITIGFLEKENMKVVRRDRFELSLSGYKPPVLTTELSEHIALITFLICFIQYFRLSECQASFRFANHIFCIAQVVRVTRLELARDNAHRSLNPMCLPIPPHPHFCRLSGCQPSIRFVTTH